MTKEQIRKYLYKKIDEIIDEIYTKSLYKCDKLEETEKDKVVKKTTVKKSTKPKVEKQKNKKST